MYFSCLFVFYVASDVRSIVFHLVEILVIIPLLNRLLWVNTSAHYIRVRFIAGVWTRILSMRVLSLGGKVKLHLGMVIFP